MPEQFAGVSMMVWLVCVYALGLVAVGWGFDILAKRTSQRFVASRTFGFTYHESNDAWLCPEDQWLWPVAFDTDNRVMRYRAKPSVCNTCPIKDTCTVSSNGRELTREVDEWPYSESGKFHRGLAVAVALFGPVIMVKVYNIKMAYKPTLEVAEDFVIIEEYKIKHYIVTGEFLLK